MSTAFFEENLVKFIQKRAAIIASEESDKAAENIRKRLLGEIDQIALSISKTYQVEYDRNVVTIRVIKEI